MTYRESLDGVDVHHDVVHTLVDGFRPLSLDLYVPVEGARALCVYLHGGGWRRGSRRAGPGPLSPVSGRLFARAARQGLAVASVDYRLSGEAPFPAQYEDLCAAIDFLSAGSGPVDVSGLPLTAWGVSAGGQLAALRALDRSARPAVRAAVLWYPVTDLRTMKPSGPDEEPTREEYLIGGQAASHPERAAAASPVAQVHTGAPPFLLLHGDADEAVPDEQSHQLQDALVAVSGQVDLRVVPGYGHLFTGMADSEVGTYIDDSVAFLLAHAAPHPPPSP